jgi:hypothetical protein
MEKLTIYDDIDNGLLWKLYDDVYLDRNTKQNYKSIEHM